MDGHRFDELTKALASGNVSRRRVLRGLLGGTLGGALAAVGLREATAACPHPEVACPRIGGECVNLRTDPENCGRCDRACGGMQVCYAGRCLSSCPSGFTRCQGSCVRACPAGLAPNPETCACECGRGEVLCDGACRDITSDPNHCGGCAGSGGEVCNVADGEICDAENGCCLPKDTGCLSALGGDQCCGDLVCDAEALTFDVDAGGGIRAFGIASFDGRCAECRPNNDDCIFNEQCCSGHCDNELTTTDAVSGGLRAFGGLPGVCADPLEICADIGAPCTDNSGCCSEFCNPSVQQCVASTCLGPGASTCFTDNDCCSGPCDQGQGTCGCIGDCP